MKKLFILMTTVPLLVLVQSAAAAPLHIDFASILTSPVGQVLFEGGGGTSTFTFPPSGAGATDFGLASSSGFGDGGTALLGLKGDITGSYTFTAPAASFTETAAVSGSGTFIIYDASSVAATASLVWDEIQTTGTSGGVNVMGIVNLG